MELSHSKYINLDLYDKKQSGIFDIPKLINFIQSNSIVMGDKVNITFQVVPIDDTTFKKKIIIEGKMKIVLEENVQKTEFEFLKDEIQKMNQNMVNGFQTINDKVLKLENDFIEFKEDVNDKFEEINKKIDSVETSLRDEINNSETRLKEYVDIKFEEHIDKYHK